MFICVFVLTSVLLSGRKGGFGVGGGIWGWESAGEEAWMDVGGEAGEHAVGVLHWMVGLLGPGEILQVVLLFLWCVIKSR